MRMNLPQPYREVVSKSLGNIHFNFYHRWFDFIFLISTIITIVIYVIQRRVKYYDLSSTD